MLFKGFVAARDEEDHDEIDFIASNEWVAKIHCKNLNEGLAEDDKKFKVHKLNKLERDDFATLMGLKLSYNNASIDCDMASNMQEFTLDSSMEEEIVKMFKDESVSIAYENFRDILLDKIMETYDNYYVLTEV